MRIDTKVLKWIVGGSACLAFLLPAQQASAQEVGLARQLSGLLFNMKNYNVGINGGIGNYGRFLLQNPTRSEFDFNERELRARASWTVGGEVGVNILPRVGAQLTFNYTNSDLAWRTDNGTGSNFLDVDDLGSLSHYTAGLELIRYLFLSSSRITPYATAGLLATWYHMGDDDIDLAVVDNSTQFRWGGTGSIGLQFRVKQQWRIRLDATTASIGNPFTGKDSFVSVFGRTIDEPERVRKTDFRLGLAYAFGKPQGPLPTTNGR